MIPQDRARNFTTVSQQHFGGESCKVHCPTLTRLHTASTLLPSRKHLHPRTLELTTGDGPIDERIWSLVQDSVWCDPGAGVQHYIKGTHQEAWRWRSGKQVRISMPEFQVISLSSA